MRASMLLESDPDAAARQAAAILARSPEHEAANLLLAAACRNLGDAERGIAAMQSVVRLHPASAPLQLELGRAYAAGGRHTEATAAFTRAVEYDPTLADAWRALSTQHFLAGDTQAGDASYLNYQRLIPQAPELADAHVALNSNRLNAAESMAQELLSSRPQHVPALKLLAVVASRRGDDGAAEVRLQQVLELAPGDAAAREELARLWIRQGRTQPALPLVDRLIAAQPGNGGLTLLKAHVLMLEDRHGEGLALVRALLEEQPDNPLYWWMAGNLLRFSGDTAGAIDAYRRAIVLRPGYGEAYWALSNLKTFRFSPDEVARMEGLLAAITMNESAAAGSDPAHLHFALGKAQEDAGQFAAAFRHYAEGNARIRAGFAYNAAAISAFVRSFETTFTAEFFAERAAWGNPSVEPIFVVGIPRCGSTLLEQILASHEDVEGAGELSDISIIARELSPFSQRMAELGQSDIESLAQRYLRQTRARRTAGKPRFVDKQLGNFLSLPLIHLMFPRAVIIDCRRDAMAVGFACYKQLFNPGVNFAYDLGEIGHYIRDYTSLMAQMDRALPRRVYRLHYEQLVANPDREVRGLLEHCGLPFDDRCLRHHENARVAQTISSEQVRRPVHAEGVDQWRHFRDWLAPLEAALGETAEACATRSVLFDSHAR
jgi:tetratricopeptide (TPR) repeat protein